MSYQAAHDLAREIAGGSRSAHEVTRELIDRITSVGAPLNAVVYADTGTASGHYANGGLRMLTHVE